MMSKLLKADGTAVYGGSIAMVSDMLGKDMAIVSKRELCDLVVLQYSAINNLMGELKKVDPGNRLLTKVEKGA